MSHISRKRDVVYISMRVLQAPCRSVLQCVAVFLHLYACYPQAPFRTPIVSFCCILLHSVAVWCSVVQCDAVCCSVSQCVYTATCMCVIHRRRSALQQSVSAVAHFAFPRSSLEFVDARQLACDTPPPNRCRNSV